MESSILFGPEIDDRALDKEIDEVNDALADTGQISPEVDTSGLGNLSMGASGGGIGGGMSDEVASLVPMADYRNRLLEDILDGVQGGGMGDGGGGGPLGSLRNILSGLGLKSIISGAIGTVSLSSILSGAIVGGLGTIAVSSLIANRADVEVNDLITDPVKIGQELLLEGLIASPVGLTANAVLNHVFGEGQPGEEGQQTGGGGGLLDDLLTGLGIGGGAFAFLNRGSIAQGIRTAGGRAAGLGRGLLGAAQTFSGVPSRVLGDLEKRGVTNILPDDLGGGRNAPATQPMLSSILRSTTGRATAPATRRGVGGGGGNPVRNVLDVRSDIRVDPSGMDDLKDQVVREVESTVVDEITSQIDRDLSIGFGGP